MEREMPVKSARRNVCTDISTQRKVEFLARPGTYPDCPQSVEIKETHMSWVFLTDGRAYKLKKPVRYPTLDFGTIMAREFNCREEIRLNRRLAPDVYLGVVRLTCERDGSLALNGSGQTVDWLVKMRRLPDEKMLDRAIEAGTATAAKIIAVADLLTSFYRNAERSDLSAEAYWSRFITEHEETRRILATPALAYLTEERRNILDAVEAALQSHRDLFEERVRSDRIVEGHGDFKPEHVCLADPPVIIDCLEFNRSLRLIDPLDELAFFGMECRRLGAPWIGALVFKRCTQSLGERVDDRLVALYTAFRACIRARLSLAHLLDPAPRESEKWQPLTSEYLDIAAREIAALTPQAGG
jgi:aminoglycoside phosphotransferase family enzyme